jgi:hypothetical protein
MTDQKPSSSEKDDSQEKNREKNLSNQETEINELAEKINKEIFEEIDRFDRLKTHYEEEVDLEIIHEELDPIEKIKQHLLIASHLRLFTQTIINTFKTNPKEIENHQDSAKYIFGAFQKAGIKALAMGLPILEMIGTARYLTPSEAQEFMKTVNDRTLDWLIDELYFLRNRINDDLDKIMKEIDNH